MGLSTKTGYTPHLRVSTLQTSSHGERANILDSGRYLETLPAEFPDSVTSRGKKHLENLISAYEQGYESYLMFLIQIENCKSFGIASDIDPEYSKVFKDALKKNVKLLCYDCKFSNKGIEINNKIKILLNDR